MTNFQTNLDLVSDGETISLTRTIPAVTKEVAIARAMLSAMNRLGHIEQVRAANCIALELDEDRSETLRAS